MVVAALVPLVPGIAEGGANLLDPSLLAIGAAVALLSSVIPYSLETEALRRLPANVFGVLMSQLRQILESGHLRCENPYHMVKV